MAMLSQRSWRWSFYISCVRYIPTALTKMSFRTPVKPARAFFSRGPRRARFWRGGVEGAGRAEESAPLLSISTTKLALPCRLFQGHTGSKMVLVVATVGWSVTYIEENPSEAKLGRVTRIARCI